MNFPHPKIIIETNRKYSSLLLEMFSETQNRICEYGTDNIWIRDNLIPHLFQKYMSETDKKITIDEFKHSMKIGRFGINTASKYLKYLGCKHC